MENDDYPPRHDRFEASVNLFIDPSQKTQIIEALSKLEGVGEIYDVKGEFDIVSMVSASSVEEFRNIRQLAFQTARSGHVGRDMDIPQLLWVAVKHRSGESNKRFSGIRDGRLAAQHSCTAANAAFH